MGKTNIPYADYVWNPVVGCTPIACGCVNCWAERLHNQRQFAWAEGGWPTAPPQYHKAFRHVQLLKGRLEDPLHWPTPGTIFVNSMSDTFHKDVPFEFRLKMFESMANASQHTYLLFTKRYLEAKEFFQLCGDWDPAEWPHVHLYFSASTQAEVDEAVPILLQIPCAVRGLSLEPLSASVKLKPSSLGNYVYVGQPAKCLTSIIVGCESGPNRRPCKLEWIRSIVQQCQAAGVKCYVKQLVPDGKNKVETEMSKFPADLRVKQI